MADVEPEGGFFQHLRGEGAQGKGFPGKDLHLGAAAAKIPKLAQSLLLPATGNHGGIIERKLSVGQNGIGLAGEGLQLLLQAAGGDVILADDGHGPAGVLPQGSQQVRAVDLTDAGDRCVLAVGDCLAQEGIFRDG